jgi:hypothetical protein
MAEGKEPAPQDGLPPDIEQECASWDWARAAGVSAQELRKALQDLTTGAGEAAGGSASKAEE